MSTMKVLESLQGENVEILCLDREESSVSGELIEVSNLGAIVKFSSHNREFVEFVPMTNINSISHKVLGQ